jgi:hypothetical protein
MSRRGRPDAKAAGSIDFDEIKDWGPWVGEIVVGLGRPGLKAKLAASDPDFIEDARDLVLDELGRKACVDAVAIGLRDRRVRLHHGTRVGPSELDALHQQGLRPLATTDREEVLGAALAGHPRWSKVRQNLAAALRLFGAGYRAGRREDGFVHACFSRSGLIRGCDHYLTHGAEVDGHVAHHLFGDFSGHKYLRQGRMPYLISFEVPFDVAAQGSHTHGELEAGRDLLALMLIGAWAFWTAHPRFTVASQHDCTAVRIPGPIPPTDLSFEAVDDALLTPDGQDRKP